MQIAVETQDYLGHYILVTHLKTSIKAQPVALAQLGERQTEVISHYIWRYSVRSAEATQLLLRLSNIRIMNILFVFPANLHTISIIGRCFSFLHSSR
jgi:hypothetical protein